MITVSYDGEGTMEIRGHAFAGKKGEDLICAAVSALALTLGENCRRSSFRPGFCRLEEGDRQVFLGIYRGFEHLQRVFPWAIRCGNFKTAALKGASLWKRK